MDALDVAIRLSFTYIYLLRACHHRCASHLELDVLVQVLDASWLGDAVERHMFRARNAAFA